MAEQSLFSSLKAQCMAEGKLYEDADFPAVAESIHPLGGKPEDWLWKRPKEMSSSPRFVIDGSSRFDLAQGELGDCWFLAAAAVLATKKDLFTNVVIPDQSFTNNYAGIFRFNFWRFGNWEEVIVDDRLPVDADGKLRYCHNRDTPDEYWGALLEKAYAKINGSYDAIRAGHIRDALVDFTGGVSEEYSLKDPDKLPPDLYEIMLKAFNMGSLLGAGIWGSDGAVTEEKLWNGLYGGHAYSITSILDCRVQGWQVKLVRLRNPWGQKEWNGAWSDGSDEWKALSEDEKTQAGIVFDDDGEFWMSFEDWQKAFSMLDIVHLTPEAMARVENVAAGTELKWNTAEHHGRWIKGVSAGGAGILFTDKDLYYTNPQYTFTLKDPDSDDVTGECTCIVSLIQKDYRKRRNTPNKKRLIVGLDVHQIKCDTVANIDSIQHYDKYVLKKQFRTRTPLREVSCRLHLDPGFYCVIPSTLRVNQEGDFLLRIYTYSRITSEPIKQDKTIVEPIPDEKVVKPVGNIDIELFWQFADDDGLIDARDLRDMINSLFRKEEGMTTTLCLEACRSLVALVDDQHLGILDYDDTLKLWDEVLFWKKVFKKYDRDHSGSIETFELRSLFRDIGITLTIDTIGCIAARYGGKDRTMFFEDFLMCLAKTMTLYSAFKIFRNETGDAVISLEKWMETTLYC